MYLALLRDLIDPSGFAALEFNLLDVLALNGVYVVTAFPVVIIRCKFKAPNRSASWFWIIR